MDFQREQKRDRKKGGKQHQRDRDKCETTNERIQPDSDERVNKGDQISDKTLRLSQTYFIDTGIFVLVLKSLSLSHLFFLVYFRSLWDSATCSLSLSL